MGNAIALLTEVLVALADLAEVATETAVESFAVTAAENLIELTDIVGVEGLGDVSLASETEFDLSIYGGENLDSTRSSVARGIDITWDNDNMWFDIDLNAPSEVPEVNYEYDIVNDVFIHRGDGTIVDFPFPDEIDGNIQNILTKATPKNLGTVLGLLDFISTNPIINSFADGLYSVLGGILGQMTRKDILKEYPLFVGTPDEFRKDFKKQLRKNYKINTRKGKKSLKNFLKFLQRRWRPAKRRRLQ